MGGYGGASGDAKGKCYYDTGGHKVKDKNAIEVAEYYIDQGKYVAFLQEKSGQKRADLSVEGQHVEVKGIQSKKTDTIRKEIAKAFVQTEGDNYKYNKETHRKGKVILLSKHSSAREAYKYLYAGYRAALKRGEVKGKVEMWYGNHHFKFN